MPNVHCLTGFVVNTLMCLAICGAQTPERSTVHETLHKVVSFYRSQVGFDGAYLWRYSSDLKHQEGEEIASRTSGWTQPPGTPAVGEAYLKGWRLSENESCREAAIEAARALVKAQLKSGGWSSHFELGSKGREKYAYRVDGQHSGQNNLTTFDDDKSQSALMLLMHVDEALEFRDAEIHEAVQYALSKMLAAQYPNGAWPQQYAESDISEEHPVKSASYPESWSRTYPGKRYQGYYTLNDSNMSHIVDMLFEAHRIYGRDDCYQAAEKTGDFFILAQMPEPQPGWAQQYDADMHPAWARKFEPPAITGGESQSVMRTLLRLYQFTGAEKFLKPIPPALAYYQSSTLADGRLARFYELKTNQPLYFTKDYRLTYDDGDMPTHYGFQVGSKLQSIEEEYLALLKTDPAELKPAQPPVVRVKLTPRLSEQAQQVISQLDARGAWVEPGKLQYTSDELNIIDMRTFIENLETLAAYAGAL